VTTTAITTASSAFTTTVSSYTSVTPGTTTYTASQTIVSGTTGSSAVFLTDAVSYTYTSTTGVSPASGTSTSGGLTFTAPGILEGYFNTYGVIGMTPLTGASYVRFSVPEIGGYPALVVVGLTTSPGSFTGAGGNCSVMDYGMCPGGNGLVGANSIRLYNKGGGSGFANLAATRQSSDIYTVAYDGVNTVNFYSNTTIVYTMGKTHGTTALVPMVSFVASYITVSGLTFGSNFGTTTVYNISTTYTTFSNTTATSFSVPSGKYATTLTTASAYALNTVNTIVQASTIGEKQTLNMNVKSRADMNNPQ
jgi:hypothetical protein